MAWRVHAAAVIGSSHIEGGIPCQDAFAHASAGDVLVAVVCDGAGSAARSHVGSARFSRAVADALAAAATANGAGEALCDADPADLAEAARLAISAERSGLRELADAEGVELNAFAATLVAAIVGPGGGWFLHVGDGIGVAELADGNVAMSLPENGEYANETYFVTGSQWSEHLRLTPIPGPVATLALMSDGAAPFVMAKNNTGLFRPFMDPVGRFLAASDEATGSAGLAATLGDPRTHTITTDDKTLLVALPG
jgi:hypothetical protein